MDSMLDASSRSYGDMGTSVEFSHSHRSFQDRALSIQDEQFTTRNELHWIKETFKKRECTRFQFKEEEPCRCQCGRLEEEHSPTKTIGELEEEWKPETHTKMYPTDAYGELEFQGAWTCTRAKYVRVSQDAKAEDVLELLTDSWGLELPKLLIEVTGGAKDFVLQPKLKRIFRQGIVKVAVSTNAWIITGGTNTGVMKHVGKALREHTLRSRKKIYALGVASWGIIDNRTDLMHRRHKPPGKVTHYRMTSSLESNGASLDPNHTHFILVDNGTSGKYGVEIELRARLEKIIAQQRMDPNSSRGIPAVCLALEGGVNTIRTVLENVSKDPPIPAVIAAGSGRAADLIAFAYEFSNRGLLESPHYVDQLRAKLVEVFPRENDQHDDLMVKLKKIVSRKNLITVFNVDDEGHGNDGIDYAILNALLKANDLSPSEQLKLSLIWNRVDIAQEKVFSQTTHWNDIALHDAMEIALTRNRVEFVKPLLEQGLLMNNFLTQERLQTLYSDLEEEQFPTLQVLHKAAHLRKPKAGKVCMKDIGHVIQHLLGKGFASKYIGHESQTLCSCKMLQCLKRPLCSCKRCQCLEGPGHDETDGLEDDEEDAQPFDDLFLWALLTKKFRMAYLMWQRGRQSIAKALIGNRLCYNMANIARAKYNTDAADEIMEECRRYEQMSIGLLDQCFAMFPEYTRCILCAKMDNWSQQTCLSLAANYHVFKFIAHPAVQDLLNHQWYGKLRKISDFKHLVRWLISGNKSSEESNEAYNNANRRQTRHWNNSKQSGLEMSEGTQADDLNGSVRIDRSVSVASLSPAEMNHSTLLHNRQHRNENLTWLRRLQAVCQAPIVKFWINTVFYVIFLFLFTYVVLHNFKPTLSWIELLVALIVFTLGTEEVRQVLMQGERETFTLTEKIKMWAQNRWNLWDLVGISFYVVGFVLRWPYGPFPCFLVMARIFLVMDIMVWYIRLLDIFSVHKIMGPYVNMIYRMVWDTMYFTVLLFVFLLSYGVARQAILYPTDVWHWSNLADILAIPYWQIYGELFMDDTGMLECRSNNSSDSMEDCRKGAAVVPFIMSLYLLIANVLLLNLLIAKFNNTFTRVQENANEIWKFQRYRLIIEYSERPCLPPPFILVVHVWYVVRWFLYCCCQRPRPPGEMRIEYDEKSLQLFYNFEEECMENYLRQQNLQQQTSIPGLIQRINERIESISLYVEEQIRHEEKERKLKRKETMKRTLSSWNNPEKIAATGANRKGKFSRELSC